MDPQTEQTGQTGATPRKGNGAPEIYREEMLVIATVVGRTPMLQHGWGAGEIERVLIRGDRGGKPKDMELKTMAELGLYHGPNDELGVPTVNLFASLRGGGRHVKFDARRYVSTAEATLLPAFLTIEGDFLPFVGLEEPPWKVDVRRGNLDNAGKKVAVGIVRPRFDKWGFTARLHVDFSEKGVNPVMIRDLLKAAGRKCGLCGFRPQKGGPFGQFDAVGLEVKPLE